MAVDEETFHSLLEGVARFTRERLIPREAEIAGLDGPPPDLLAEMAEMGLFGLGYPEEFGGLGLSAVQEMEVGFELGRCAPALRNVISIHNGIGGQVIVRHGTDSQKERYLRRLASGEIIAAFAMTEPEAGSDAASVRTRAVREGGGWRLDGRKRFISNAPFAGVFTVVARTQGDDGSGINAFLVDAGTPGLTLGKPEKKMGQDGAPICDLVFDNCQLEADSLLGGVENLGLKIALSAIDRGRLFIAACSAGLSLRLVEQATAYAESRIQFGKPITQHQLVQAMLADSMTEAFAARAMVRDAALQADRGVGFSMEASMCKLFATEALGRVADRAVQVHGGNGYVSDYGVERLYRDVRVLRLYEGTSQIQQLVIARNLMKRLDAGVPL